MKVFFAVICVGSVLMGAYCHFTPLPSMRARYRCFFREGTLNGVPDRTSTNFLTEADMADLPEGFAEQYQDAVSDGNVMAEQYSVAHVLTLVLCGMLFATSLVGLRIAAGKKEQGASNKTGGR